MRTLSGRRLVMALAAVTAAASAQASAAAPAPGPRIPAAPCDDRCAPPLEPRIELLSPLAAVPLAAGSAAVLEWAPLPGLARLPAREEWEAFLSLDGGRSYPVRITPHLDSDLRRTLWEVPEVATADARILLRFGDERRETVIELPERFTIAAPSAPASSLRAALPGLAPRADLAAGLGETARPCDAGVVAWTVGSRRGAGRRQVVAASAQLREGWRQPAPGRAIVALATRRSSFGPLGPARGSACRRGAHDAAFAQAPPAPHAPLPPIDRMLQTSRLNE